MSNIIRLIISDRCPITRYGLAVMLDPFPDLEIVRLIPSVADLIKNDEKTECDILLVDPYNDVPIEYQYLDEFRRLKPEIKIIIFTGYQDQNLIIKLLGIGIHGYLLKKAEAPEIMETIHAVHNGESCMEPCVGDALIENIGSDRLFSEARFSDREIRVLNLIAEGSSNKEIADALYISTKAVKHHIGSIFSKLGLRNRTGAAMRMS